MAKLFPEIQVFTTLNQKWSLEWIQRTPMKFSKKLKVLDLSGFRFDDSFMTNVNGVLDKVEADGVVHIRLVSLPRNNTGQVIGECRMQSFSEAECISKILSIVSVDHVIFLDSSSLEDVYTICAQINDMQLQSPIHAYFQNSYLNLDSAVADQRWPLRLMFCDPFSGKIGPDMERVCLNQRLNHINSNLKSRGRLVVCKVMGCQGQGQLKWAADAIDWLLNAEDGPKNYCPVDIISMSFGCGAFDPDLRRAISEAAIRGKTIVAAASNDGRKKMTNVAFPARFGDVICVGSCNDLGQPSSFTPTGREVDFLAPGEDINAPSSAGIDRSRLASGTSEATPIVAGIAAMVISYAESIGGQEMRSAVCHTAVMREILRKMASMPGHHDEHMGYGNLDPLRLFKYGPGHFRQVVEEIVGPLPVPAMERRDAETQT